MPALIFRKELAGGTFVIKEIDESDPSFVE
jgi:hypothetical protein